MLLQAIYSDSFLISQRKFPYLENKSRFLKFPTQTILILEMQEGKRKKLGKKGKPKKNNKKILVLLFGVIGEKKRQNMENSVILVKKVFWNFKVLLKIKM